MRGTVALAVAGGLVWLSVSALAPTAAAQQPTAAAQSVVPLCTPSDPGLAELSGMTVIGDTLYGVGDSGSDDRVAQLDSATCAVTRWIPNPVDPNDTEDLASRDGVLWLADIGDNDRRRETVALVRVDPADGSGEVHRLAYPDGPHDGEALLLGPDGVGVIVTKSADGRSGIYRTPGPVETLPTPGPTALERVGDLTVARTSTVGGPPLIEGSILITGGAVSADGRVAALRTYTDVLLFTVADGNIADALSAPPVAGIAVPGQPQGESAAFEADGDLLLGSEEGVGSTGSVPPIDVVRDAVALVQSAQDSAPGSEPQPTPSTVNPAVLIVVTIVVIGVIVVVVAGAMRIFRR